MNTEYDKALQKYGLTSQQLTKNQFRYLVLMDDWKDILGTVASKLRTLGSAAWTTLKPALLEAHPMIKSFYNALYPELPRALVKHQTQLGLAVATIICPEDYTSRTPLTYVAKTALASTSA